MREASSKFKHLRAENIRITVLIELTEMKALLVSLTLTEFDYASASYQSTKSLGGPTCAFPVHLFEEIKTFCFC